MSCAPPEGVPANGRLGRIECNLDNDSRLLVSLGVILSHAARRAGLPDETQQDVAAAAGEASREMVAAGNGAGSISTTHLVVEEFSDRLEVTIDSPAGGESEGIRKRLEGKAGDRVRFESREGCVRVTLLKPCAAAKSGS
jgi:anti-sigma regulatory factor (Ser/Thr protein kinase)